MSLVLTMPMGQKKKKILVLDLSKHSNYYMKGESHLNHHKHLLLALHFKNKVAELCVGSGFSKSSGTVLASFWMFEGFRWV